MMTIVGIHSWRQNGCMLWIVIALSLVYGRLSRVEQTPDTGGSSLRAAIAEEELAPARY